MVCRYSPTSHVHVSHSQAPRAVPHALSPKSPNLGRDNAHWGPCFMNVASEGFFCLITLRSAVGMQGGWRAARRCAGPWWSLALEFAVQFSTTRRGCEWNCCISCRFMGSSVGFTDSVVDVRFASKRCARQLVRMVWSRPLLLSMWMQHGSMPLMPYFPARTSRSDVVRLSCSGHVV